MMMMKLKRNRTKKEKGKKGKREKGFLSQYIFLTSILVLLNLSCQPNQTILKDVSPPATPMATVETKKTTFEQDLLEMQTAGFDYILVFRRKDGGFFDKDDRKYLRQNTPIETNRWRESDDGKAYIAGSGFGFTPEQMEALRNRFIIEDYSKPEIKEAANKAANTDANKQTKESNKLEKPQANK